MEEKLLPAEEAGAEKNLPLATRNALNSVSAGVDFDLTRLEGKQTFCAAEKLKSKKIINQLFKEGKSVAQNGFTLVYLPTALSAYYPVQAGFTVPKRFFKHAADRNRIKRLMREVYRANKYDLYKKLVVEKQQLAIMFVYNGKKIPDFELVTKALIACMKKII